MDWDDYDPRTDLRRWDEDRPRTQQPSVGPSDTGGCIRQHAYRHHRTEPSDRKRSEAAARLGSLIHLGYAAMLTQMDLPGRESEVWVTLPGLRAPGRADDVDRINRVVLDVKTTSGRAFTRWCTYGLPERMWDQVDIYAYGLWLLDGPAGEPHNWTLAILLINRETGEEQRFERPADPDHGARLVELLIQEQEALDASNSPEEFPREGAGPGRGMPCDWCPWMRRCWGPPRHDGLSEQSASVADDPAAVAAHADAYLTAREEESKAKRIKDDARAFLEGLPPGLYGDAEIGWTGGNPTPPVPDADAMADLLTSLGYPVPLSPAGRTRRSISVKRVAPEPVRDEAADAMRPGDADATGPRPASEAPTKGSPGDDAQRSGQAAS